MKNLSNAEDIELITLVKEKADDSAFLEICRRYEDIFYNVCRKFTNMLTNAGLCPDDIFEEKNCIILHCISTYSPHKKAKLGTWIGNYARYLCLNSITARRFIRPVTENELEEFQENANLNQIDNYIPPGNDEKRQILNLVKSFKDKRAIEIFKYRYSGDKKMTWSEISKKINLSTQTIINIHNLGILRIRKNMKKLNKH